MCSAQSLERHLRQFPIPSIHKCQDRFLTHNQPVLVIRYQRTRTFMVKVHERTVRMWLGFRIEIFDDLSMSSFEVVWSLNLGLQGLIGNPFPLWRMRRKTGKQSAGSAGPKFANNSIPISFQTQIGWNWKRVNNVYQIERSYRMLIELKRVEGESALSAYWYSIPLSSVLSYENQAVWFEWSLRTIALDDCFVRLSSNAKEST